MMFVHLYHPRNIPVKFERLPFYSCEDLALTMLCCHSRPDQPDDMSENNTCRLFKLKGKNRNLCLTETETERSLKK